MELKSADVQSFASYSQFKNLKEFNNHMEMWLVDTKAKLTKSECIGLKRLLRFAAKVPGVCNPKIATILKAIHEEHHDHGISRSTLKRLFHKLKELGILVIYETSRKNGSQSSNLYVFQRYPRSRSKLESPTVVKMDNQSESIKLLHKRDVKKQANLLDASYTSDCVPKDFTNLVKFYIDQAEIIEEYWKLAKIASYRHNREKEKEVVLGQVIDAFKQMIRKLKLHKVQNPIAYYYGVLNKKLQYLYFEELAEMVGT